VLIAIGKVASNVERVEMKLDQLLGEMDSKFDNLGSKLASLEIKSCENEEQKLLIGRMTAAVSSKIDKVVAKLDNVTDIVENDYALRPVTQPGASPSAESSEGQAPIRLIV